MKGEKIVTVLCNALVNPLREDVWPHDWTKPHPAAKRASFAYVEGAFLRDGEVWLLLSNGMDGKLAESKATNWVVEHRATK